MARTLTRVANGLKYASAPAVGAVGVGLLADAAERWLFNSDQNFPWWGLLGVGLGCLALVWVISSDARVTRLGHLKGFFWPVLITSVAAPWGLSWLSDGIEHSASRHNDLLIIVGALVLLVGGLLATLLFQPDVGSENRRVPSYAKVDDDVLDNAKVLIATIGPWDPNADNGSAYPKALLYTLRRCRNLKYIITVDDGNVEGRMWLTHYEDLLHISFTDDHVKRVKAPRNNLPQGMEEIRTHVVSILEEFGIPYDRVIADVTGGSVPQTMALLDIARSLPGVTPMYVVAKQPSDLEDTWGMTRPDHFRRLQQKLARTDLEELYTEADLSFVSLVEQEPEQRP